MLHPSLEKACPVCKGNLHLYGYPKKSARYGYEVHTYACLDCGPIINVNAGADLWSHDWLNTRAIHEEKNSC